MANRQEEDLKKWVEMEQQRAVLVSDVLFHNIIFLTTCLLQSLTGLLLQFQFKGVEGICKIVVILSSYDT